MRRLLKAAIVATLLAMAAPAGACGEADAGCAVPLGSYHAITPAGSPPASGWPVVVHLHGYGQSGRQVIGDERLTTRLLARGYALLAPNGLAGADGRPSGWSFGNLRPEARDEAAFLRQILDDARVRLPIDRRRLLLTGYSIGGSLAWYIACEDPALATAYAPLAGGFWRPHPGRCAGPAAILHTHGWRDLTVPFEGRRLRPDLAQGDIAAGLALWRVTNRCQTFQPDGFSGDAGFWQRHWTRCDAPLSLALHAGGHELPEAWPDLALDWLEAVAAASR